MAFALKHHGLGDVLGLKVDGQGVIQYLGIQYATLAHRFAVPDLRTVYGQAIDATSRGWVFSFICFLPVAPKLATLYTSVHVKLTIFPPL